MESAGKAYRSVGRIYGGVKLKPPLRGEGPETSDSKLNVMVGLIELRAMR